MCVYIYIWRERERWMHACMDGWIERERDRERERARDNSSRVPIEREREIAVIFTWTSRSRSGSRPSGPKSGSEGLRLCRITDGIGTPDPNPRNLVNGCL